MAKPLFVPEVHKDLDLRSRGSRSVEFLLHGPKGENADTIERLIVEEIRDQVFWRRYCHPEDPTHTKEEIKQSPEYLDALGQIKDGYHELLAFLKRSMTFFSMRYQGHMNWDLTMPGMLGYFATMLYNPNNVAFERSTVTTLIELMVGDDLCRMLGYPFVTAGNRPFSAFLEIKSDNIAGSLYVCDATRWISALIGTDSHRRLWANTTEQRCLLRHKARSMDSRMSSSPHMFAIWLAFLSQ